MTKIKVFAGACGFYNVIKVEALDHDHVSIKIVSACRLLRSLNGDEFLKLNWTKGVFCKVSDSLIYRMASERSIHPDCPGIPAIVKGIQVEIGAAVPKDAYIKFILIEGDKNDL